MQVIGSGTWKLILAPESKPEDEQELDRWLEFFD
jgi:hypothetical protein